MKCLLLHGKGGSPNGTVAKLEAQLRPLAPQFEFERPALLHGDPDVLAEVSVADLAKRVEPNVWMVGISLGGLIAAALQEQGRDDVRVIAVSSPTWADGVRLQQRKPNRLALFSSFDDVIAGRTAEWPRLAEAHDLTWLSHDTDPHLPRLVQIIAARLRGDDLAEAIQSAKE